MAVKRKTEPPRPPKIELPFTPRQSDPGEWVWDHRVGLCVMIIAYLAAGIIFMSARIMIGRKQASSEFYVELEKEKAAPEKPRKPERMEKSDDFSQIRNRISNENAGEQAKSKPTTADLNPRLEDDRGTSAKRIYDEAAAAMERTRANREAYEEGLRRSQEDARQNRAPKTENASAKSADTRAAGKVTVSFSLVNPIRYASDLFIPAYQCRGGGELILDVTVNRNGKVTAASLARASESVDDCMIETATRAAYASRFNIDPDAPEKHRGTITYVFMPQ